MNEFKKCVLNNIFLRSVLTDGSYSGVEGSRFASVYCHIVFDRSSSVILRREFVWLKHFFKERQPNVKKIILQDQACCCPAAGYRSTCPELQCDTAIIIVQQGQEDHMGNCCNWWSDAWHVKVLWKESLNNMKKIAFFGIKLPANITVVLEIQMCVFLLWLVFS